ncbi:hypothetical protein BD311DRAFT_757094 [Dichomitus squalens]|uniref:Uncharacterized protein n=1 Tax=Dichomitus squalens TaxID=114155 RepID=A0A4Q9MRM0_9APHY|nr:hypothetical protein BD311DRAFT_757094 [Dichomitus squalens]
MRGRVYVKKKFVSLTKARQAFRFLWCFASSSSSSSAALRLRMGHKAAARRDSSGSVDGSSAPDFGEKAGEGGSEGRVGERSRRNPNQRICELKGSGGMKGSSRV